jgi:hypothetical protein
MKEVSHLALGTSDGNESNNDSNSSVAQNDIEQEDSIASSDSSTSS